MTLRRQRTRNFSTFFLGLLFFLAAGVSVLSVVVNAIGEIGLALWLLQFLTLIFVGLWSFVQLAVYSWKNKTFFTLALLLAFGCLLFINSINPANVSHETTQQIACGLNWQNDPWSSLFSNTCFLGYPTRQYVVLSFIPAVFGRSVSTLNTGVALFAFAGTAILAFGLQSLKSTSKKTQDVIIAIGLSLFVQFGYINWLLFHYFEQSILPFIYTCFFVGFYVLFSKFRNNTYLFLLGITLSLAIFSYTPGLALVGLALVVLSALLVTKSHKTGRYQKLTIGCVLLMLVTQLIASFFTRTDVRLFQDTAAHTLLQYVTQTELSSLLLILKEPVNTIKYATFFSMIWLLSGTVLALTRNKKMIVVVVWIVAVFLAAFFFTGYIYYPAHYRIHRFTMAIPVLIALSTYGFIRLKLKFGLWIFISILTISLLSGTRFYLMQMSHYQQDDRTKLSLALRGISNQSKTYGETMPAELVLLDTEPYQDLLSILDKSRFFAPAFSSSEVLDLDQNECPQVTSVVVMSQERYNHCVNQIDATTIYSYLDTQKKPYVIVIP